MANARIFITNSTKQGQTIKVGPVVNNPTVSPLTYNQPTGYIDLDDGETYQVQVSQDQNTGEIIVGVFTFTPQS